MSNSLRLAVVLSVAATTACANYASFQEADTLPTGHSKTGVGITATKYKLPAGTEVDDITVPAVNVWYRRGIAENLEVHGNLWLPLGASIGGKYQLTGNRRDAGLSLSLGIDVGYLSITTTDSMDNDYKQSLIDTYVPIYIGYRTGPGFAAYVVPKYILRTSTGDGGTAFGHLAGSTVGLALGSGTQFLLEGSVFYDLDLKEPIFNGGIGLAF